MELYLNDMTDVTDIRARYRKRKSRFYYIKDFFFELKKYQIREHEKEFKKEKKRKENVKFTKKYLITLNTSLHRYR